MSLSGPCHMAHWRTRGFVQDSEDSEDEDEGDDDDNGAHNNPTIKAREDVLCPPVEQEQEQEQERMFFRIDDFTDRSSPARISHKCTAFPTPASRPSAELAKEPDGSIANPIERSLGPDVLSPTEKIWSSQGEESELQQQAAPDCSAGRGNPTTNLCANAGLLSLPRSSPPPNDEDHAEISAPLPPPSSPILEVGEQYNMAPSVGEQAEMASSIGPITRSLRKRNPIQLHPYLLEGERYRQSLKARGLKPLRINGGVQPLGDTSRSPTAYESDVEPWQDKQPQTRNDGSRTLPSSPPTLAGGGENAFASSPALLRSSQEEFPDVDVLLHADATKFVREGFKRRKVPSRRLQSPQATPTGASQPLRPLSGQTTTLRHGSPAIQSEQATVELPISPPPTSSRELSMGDCPVDPSRRSSHVRSPDTPDGAAGGHGRLPPQIFELSDDSESDTGPLYWQLPYSSTNRRRHTRPSSKGDPSRWWDHAEEADDVEEDNCIDAMLPPRGQRRTILGHHEDHQRQQKVTDFIGTGIDSPHERGSIIMTPQTGRPTLKRSAIRSRRKANAALKPKSTPRTQLGVIDVVKNNLPGQRAPSFIRLAHRRARARRDRGRHSPTKKQFQLATREETEEVQTILEDWAGGRLSPATESSGTSSGAVTERRPLANVSTNVQSSPETEGEPRPNSTPPPPGDPTPRGSSKKSASGRMIPRVGISKMDAPQRNPQSSTRALKIRSRPASFLSPWETMVSAARPAQLESTVTRYRDRTQQIRPGFQLKLAEIDRQYQMRILEDPKAAKVQLSRFLSSGQARSPLRARDGRQREHRAATEDDLPRPTSPPRPAPRRKPRKRTPQQLDIRAREFRQPPIEALAPVTDATIDSPDREEQAVVLKGLSPFGTSYPISFGMVPLQLGTYFHESTFIGSGVFAKAARADYSLKHARAEGQTSITVGSTHYRWGAWNETVSTELGRLVIWASDVIIQARANDEGALSATKIEELPSTLWSLSRYFADSLLFLDGVDRKPFVQRCCHLLLELLEALGSMRRPSSAEIRQPSKPRAQISTVLLVLTYQVYRIAQADVEPLNMTAVEGLVRSAALQLLSCIGPTQLERVRFFHLGNRQQTTREAGVRDEFFLVEAIVVARHVLARLNIPRSSFWDLVNTESGWTIVESDTDVAVFERLWRDLFTLLPLHEFDEDGVLRVGRRFQVAEENWSLVRKMVSRVFKIYRSHPESQSPRFNSYCRAIFARCHHLLFDWGWHKCENIIGTLFDFLALNNLGHLRHEESHGSAQFLESLDRSPDLRIHARDRCFHTFLKIAASGIKRLCQAYPESKIRNIVFRLMPNHGRQYPKGQLVRPEELDSLRNHHDLLCTLYWASPPPCRPSISIIRDLVDAETSHADACRVNIRAWLNLVRFQLSTDEPATALTALSSWHGTLISKLLTQQGVIRTEAEANHATTHTGVSGSLASELFKPRARADQQALEDVISYALSSLTSAMEWSRYAETSITLLEKRSTVAIFSLFELRKRGADRLVVQSLQVVKEFARKNMELSKVQASQRSSEESQEYGDWSAIMEAAAMSPLKDAAEQLEKVVSEGLGRLLSNAFGADEPPEDSVLQETVDTWALGCQLLADASLKQWDDFIGEYSRHSWTTLRNTEQTRKYTAYFMAKVVEADEANYQTQRLLFLTHWVTSLVERESMLKFQHTFTNAVLNADPSEPLLKNLPFTFQVRDGAYSITLREFSERRLSLISSEWLVDEHVPVYCF